MDWRSSFRRACGLVAVAALSAALGGCGRFAVRPSEKEYLSDRTMRFDTDPQETAADQHVADNREGSVGGGGTAGGGCGCN